MVIAAMYAHCYQKFKKEFAGRSHSEKLYKTPEDLADEKKESVPPTEMRGTLHNYMTSAKISD
jgi:hypothetical protein